MSSPIPKGAKTKREALRELLSDGKWHHMDELRKVGGWRYGARLLELRQRDPALVIEHRATFPSARGVRAAADNCFEYRAVLAIQAELPLAAKRTTRLAELVRENLALKRRVAELESAGVGA